MERFFRRFKTEWMPTADYRSSNESEYRFNNKYKSVANFTWPLQAQYSGVNILLLWSETIEKGYSSPYWLTYKQAAELGGNVIKGQKGTAIIYYTLWEKKNEQGEDEKIPMLKSFTVFNLDQKIGRASCRERV